MNSSKIYTNLFWRLIERFGAQGVTFIVSIVLARLLDPEVYGTVALVTVITTIMQVFVDSGLGNALIQKKEADDVDFSSVFYFNIVMCTFLYLVMFFSAPLIANFYEIPELVPIVRVISLTLIISGLKNVQQAYVSRNLLFKRFFFSTLGGTLVSAVVGIYLAYNGYGVWALVFQSLSNTAMGTFVLWFTVKWRPRLVFSFSRLKALFSFGWKLLISSLLDTVYNDIRQLVIGKLDSAKELAFYNKGKQFPDLLVTNINASIDSVLLPVMSSQQDSKETVRAMTRRAIKTSVYVMAPIMVGLAVCAKPFITLVLTEKWLDCVPFMVIFCITYMFYPVHTANLNAIKAMGRSDLYLKLEVIKKTVGIIILLISINFGVMAIAYSLLVSCLTSQIINSWPNKKLLNYSYLEQLKDILPSIALAVVMGIIVFFVQYLKINEFWILVIQVVLGAMIYIGGSYLFKLESFKYILSSLKSFKSKAK